jgi:hypothetical protein
VEVVELMQLAVRDAGAHPFTGLSISSNDAEQQGIKILQNENMRCYGAFAKLRRATLSFVMSVRPSARNNSISAGWILMKFDVFAFFFWNMSRKFRFR